MNKVFGIIVTYKPDIEILEKCVNSLLANQIAKLIIVDNTPGKYQLLEKLLENFRRTQDIEIIYLNDNYGIAYAQNIGIKKALEEGADFVLLSDQDTIYPLDYVEKMLECFKENKVAAAGPLFYSVNERKSHPFIKKGFLGFKKIYPTNGKHEVFQIIASGMIIKTEFLHDIGLMCEQLFIDWVDLEWCWRAIKKGYKIIGNADVIINHRLGNTSKSILYRSITLRNPLRHYYITRNAFYLSLRSNSLDFLHKLTLFLKSFRYIIGFTLLSKPHFLNFKYTLKGFYHGFIGKLGKLDEEH
jgi:rhamnosyltransferase